MSKRPISLLLDDMWEAIERVEPHGQSPWHPATTPRVGRHPAHALEEATPAGPRPKAVARWRVERYTGGMTHETFLHDEKTADAVVRNLEIIGEAANRLPEEFKAQHSDIAWEQIVGLRHRIVHDYFGIDLALVWQILQQDLPSFKAQLRQFRSAA